MITDWINLKVASNLVLTTMNRFIRSAVNLNLSFLRRLLGSITLAGFVSANTSGCVAGAPLANNKALTDSDGNTKVVNDGRREDRYEMQKKLLIDEIRGQGVRDERVLAALESVPRHQFVPANFRTASYENGPLPIGQGQTISQPYIVAYMTEALKLKREDKVLEIGTGSGYQGAILAKLVNDVYSIEVLPELSKQAQKTFEQVGIENVHLKVGDGYKGWPEQAPFDAIIVTAAPPEIPEALESQLADGGRLIVPVGGNDFQQLVLITRDGDKFTRKKLLPVRFVPMVPAEKPVAGK